MSCKCIPSVAASLDDCIVVVEDSVAELVLAQILPDVLDRIEFGRIGWKFKQADVVRDLELSAGLMPSGAVEQDDGMASKCDVATDLVEMQVHGLAVGQWQNEGNAFVVRRADGAE